MNIGPWESISGQDRLLPGQLPSIVGQRPILDSGRLGRLLRGQGLEQLGRTLASVFTLCAHAHCSAAEWAVACARTGQSQQPSPEAQVQLWLETARDHLRSIALDWPQRLAQPIPPAQALGWLRGCPLPLVAPRARSDAAAAQAMLRDLRLWLEREVLGQAVSTWLVAHREPETLARWCDARAPRLLPARCLADGFAMAQGLTPPQRGLNALDPDPAIQTRQLLDLARGLGNEGEFAQRPTWLGECAETGPWTRLRDRARPVPHSAWTRLSARWMELMEIAAAEPGAADQQRAPLLSCGALPLAQGQALAWCEMARGLLLHWVQIDPQGAVLDYRVLAPTEWNFHPEGALARAVSALPLGATAAAQTLAAAFDPCVACTVQPVATGAVDGA